MSENIDVKSLIENSTEDFSSIITVNSTSYNVYDHWIKLAANYFNIETTGNFYTSEDNSSLNLLKAGLFGYFNEIASHEIKNAVFHRNVLYDEHFLNSASFPESIYNFAKLYNVPISTAHPAHMLVELVIRKDDLLNTSLKKELVPEQVIDINTLKTYKLIISKNYEFSVNKFKYLLPYDVEVLMKQNSPNDYTITASYVMNDSNFPYYEEISSPYIKVYQEIVNGETYVFFALDIYQMERSVQEFEILSEDISDNLFYTTKFQNQLAYFNVYYTYKGETFLLNQYFNNTYTPLDSEEKYCYYTFLDDDKVQISFSSLPNSFRPRYNSTITIECMTTLGDEGNFTYKGEIKFNFSNENETTFTKLSATVLPITDSSNGSNKLSTSGMKQRIIQEILTRDNLITDSDLEIYFTNVNNNNSINGSHIKFIKKQDDFLKRIYNSFLLLREKDRKVIPTNTAKFVVLDKTKSAVISDDDQDSFVFPEHSIIKCSFNTEVDDKTNETKNTINFEYMGTSLTEEIRKSIINQKTVNSVNNERVIYYINPFLLKINDGVILNSNYFEMDLNETFNMNYSYLNNLVPTSLIINKINIEKENNYTVVDEVTGQTTPILEKEIKPIIGEDNSEIKGEVNLSSDTYRITFELNSNESIDEVDQKIKIRGILLSSDGKTNYGYFEFKRYNSDNNENISEALYEAKISTNREFDTNGNLCLVDSLYNTEGEVQDKVFINSDVIMKIGILYKDNKLSLYNEDITEYQLFNQNFPSNTEDVMSDYTLALSVETSESIKFFKNISNVMSSIITKESENEYKTELIPLIDAEYFLYNSEEIYSILNSYINIMETCLPRLENNTEIDMKFYNSYGPSLHYYVDQEIENGDGIVQLKTIPLSRVDILLDFNIHLYESIDDNIDASIKKFISDFVEACNIDGIVPISNLIRLLEINFPVIKFIEYNGLSGEYDESINNKYQKIEDRDLNFLEMSKQEIIEYVPEYVNLKKGLKNYSVISEDNSVINLSKKYEYLINITYK